MKCVTSISYRYSLNGHHSRLLKARRGLIQGDPISPLLFVLMMEYLHRCFGQLAYQPYFNYYPKCEKLKLTNICFADDLLLFIRGDEKSIQLMMEHFHSFSAATGLVANKAKCKVYFGGISAEVKNRILQETGFFVASCHFDILEFH